MTQSRVLPDDVLLLCGIYLSRSEALKTLSSLARCSHLLHELITPLLYQHISVESDKQLRIMLNSLTLISNKTDRKNPFTWVKRLTLCYFPSSELCQRVHLISQQLQRLTLLPDVRTLRITSDALDSLLIQPELLAVPHQYYEAIGPSLVQQFASLLNPHHLCLECRGHWPNLAPICRLVSQVAAMWSTMEDLTTHGGGGLHSPSLSDNRPTSSRPVRYRHYVSVSSICLWDKTFHKDSSQCNFDYATLAERMYTLIYERLFQESRSLSGGSMEMVLLQTEPSQAAHLMRQVVKIVKDTVLPSLQGRALVVSGGTERLRRVRFVSEKEAEACKACEG